MTKIGKLKWDRTVRLASLSLLIYCLFVYGASAEELEIGDKNNPKIAEHTEPMFVDIVLPKHQVYLGETLRVQYDVYVAQARGLVLYDAVEPDFKAWTALEIPPPKPSFARLKHGHYNKEPFAIYYVNANRLGQIPLPKLAVEKPFANPPIWISNAPSFVEVIPPPSPSPKGFDLHNVGDIQITMSGNEDVKMCVGDVLNFDLKVTSNTPSQNLIFILDKESQTRENFRIQPPYPIASKSEIVDEKYVSETHYRIRISPLKEGKWPRPQYKIVYFNPDSQRYETARTEVQTLDILPAKTEPTKASHQFKSTSTQRQLEPLKLKAEKKKDAPSLYLGLIPLLLVLSTLVLTVLYERRKTRAPWRQRRRDIAQFKQDFIKVKNAETQLIDLIEFLLIIFDLEPNTPSVSVVERLQKTELPKHEIETLIQGIEALRHASYSDKKALDKKEAKTIASIIEKMMLNEEENNA